MAISKIKTGSITDSAITEAKLGSNAVTTGKISDGTIVNADVSPSAAIAASKTVICTSVTDTNTFNISLLGFKMAVNEGLTVFNLVDGIVDEFHDESGTDEGEGSNDTYCATSDFYRNVSLTPASFSAGFTGTSVTEADTSAAVSCASSTGEAKTGTFTVPSGMTSLSIKAWGAGGAHGGSPTGCTTGAGGGGFASGTLAVTAGQVLHVGAGFGGKAFHPQGGSEAITERGGAFGGGDGNGDGYGGGGGGMSIITATAFDVAGPEGPFSPHGAPNLYLIAAGGGGSSNQGTGGAGGGLTGDAGGQTTETTGNGPELGGGGGDQEQGGAAGPLPQGGTNSAGQYLAGGDGASYPAPGGGGGGGGGYYGGGGAGSTGSCHGPGGGGSSYYGHPQITSGATEEGAGTESGGAADPAYVADTGEGAPDDASPAGDNPPSSWKQGENGYVLLTGTGSTTSPGASTTIISTAFAASSVPTTSRIVVFQENVDSITLNTDLIASISRNGGSNFTTATLSDSGYVTGSSGQRILTGQATISGQPSGQSMRWKLALANNTSKIHGVSLQWA